MVFDVALHLVFTDNKKKKNLQPLFASMRQNRRRCSSTDGMRNAHTFAHKMHTGDKLSGFLIARSDFAGGAADRNRKEWDLRESLLTSPAGKRAGILDTCRGCLVVSDLAAALRHALAQGPL